MSAITSSANGTYTDCGLGQGVGLVLTCGGPSCGILSQFPHLQCSNDPISSTTSCTNGVTCPGTPNFKSIFQMQQHPDNSVSTQQLLEIDGQDFDGTDDGHGVVSYGPTNVATSPTPSATGTGTGAGGGTAAGGSPGTSTGTGTGTGGPSISHVASDASFRTPPLSKTLFVVLVIFGMFVGQSMADGPTAAHLRVTTGMSLLWLIMIPARVAADASCLTVGNFPVLFSTSLFYYLATDT